MKSIVRFFAVLFLYAMIYLQLSGENPGALPQNWSGTVLLFVLSGPALLFVGISARSPFTVFSSVFLKALFVLVVLYPSGNNPALYINILTVFSVEAVLMLDSWWRAVFFYQSFIILFVCILPRRAWTHSIQIPPVVLFPVLLAYLFFVTLAFRKYLRLASESERKDREISQQHYLLDQVYLLNSQFQEYALNAERKSAGEERKRITRDIHDIMGYTLVNLRVMLEVALDLAGTGNVKLSALLEDAIHHTREGLQTARKDLRNLRVIEENTESWISRMHRIASTFSDATGISVQVSWGNVTRINCPRLKSAVYQFVQEALTNSFKHGKADAVELEFRISGEAPDDVFVARVIDNGLGAKDVVPGIGFSGMQERIAALDGETGYRNPGRGFEVWISIPMLAMRKDI
jgi:signal transduction histidine kinase